MNSQTLKWQRGESQLEWYGESVTAPDSLLWASELPEGDGIAVVTLFDEQTPPDEPNAFIYRSVSGFIPVEVSEDGHLVRVLGCYAERDAMVFNATNDFEYILNPKTLEMVTRRFYR